MKIKFLAFGVSAVVICTLLSSCVTINVPKTTQSTSPDSASTTSVSLTTPSTTAVLNPSPTSTSPILFSISEPLFPASVITSITTIPVVVTSLSSNIPQPPEVPTEVIRIWESNPPTAITQYDSQGALSLELNPYTNEVYTLGSGLSVQDVPKSLESQHFYLSEDQWVDIIVSSVGIPVDYLAGNQESVTISAECWGQYEGDRVRTGFPTIAQNAGEPEERNVGPFTGKPLYENAIINTEHGVVYTTAARMVAWNGAGEYWFTFSNWNHQSGTNIAYRIYILTSTPGWMSVNDNELKAWYQSLYNLLVTKEINQTEYDNAIENWKMKFE